MIAARVTEGAICLSSSSHFAPTANSNSAKPVMLPPRVRKAPDKSRTDRIGNLSEHDRYGSGGPLYFCQRGTRRSKNHIRIQSCQFCRTGSNAVGVSTTPTVMNFQVTAFDPTVLQQTQPKSCNSSLPFRIGFRGRNQYAEPPHAVALLRTRDERPRCSAPDRRNELAPLIRSPRRRG